MHLARHSITSTSPIQILDARFDADANIFTASTPTGFAVYRAWPLQLLRKREFTDGTLTIVVPLHTSSILFLVGGGPSPLYPPNKVVVWDEALGREVAELEFRERVRGVACRRGWLVVALRRRVVAYEVGETITRYHEWDTCDNQQGLVAIATAAYSTLLAIAGRQLGHVQLIHLPPCRPPAPKSPPSPTIPRGPPPQPKNHPISVIAAHSSTLRTLTVLPSGRLLATTSSRGTLLRVWDSHTGKLVKEFRRGSDKADIYGVAFRPDEQDVCVWSDKGTVHVFSLSGTSRNRQSSLSPLTPFLSLPKYFDSEWSYAQYHIPSQTSHLALSAGTSGSKLSDVVEDEKCTVAWIKVPLPSPTSPSQGRSIPKQPPQVEYQLVALTYSGGWYRIALPSSSQSQTEEGKSNPISSAASVRSGRPSPLAGIRSSGGSSIAGSSRLDKGKQKEASRESKSTHSCILKEFRRYGRWDGWG
ncbi:hypothetical protein SCHPADRAFT_912496 [Schizopora paradoxa]|uniref:Uncharacterized protein n=1 Tax=Schizopora paradoxa TaxID=27342 RepID=A0A0H2SDJ0_9AGAM|nr:hypothetical protein SCHPADRAFT_912496 [Schizopora paradoxa]